MEAKDLEKDCESVISQVLTEQNKELETITNEKTLTNLGPKELIALWRDKFGGLSIADLKDTKGYTSVVKAIALCRTTRTTLDKKRMEQKRFFLDAGKVIDSHYKELISLVEPIEEELNAKKKAIDDEKERIKQEKEKAEQAIFDSRVKQLMDAGCDFDGTAYYVKETTFSVTSIYVKNFDEIQFANVLENVKREVEILKARKQEEAEKERIEREKAKLLERTRERINTLTTFGFEDSADHGEGIIYTRKFISKRYEHEEGGKLISAHEVETMQDDTFDAIITLVRDDIKQAQNDKEEFDRQQQEKEKELQRRENELKEKEEKQKQELHANRMNKIKALGFQMGAEPWTFSIRFPNIDAIQISINPDLDEAAFNAYMIKFGEIVKDAKDRSDKAVAEAEKLQKEKWEKERLEREEQEKQKEQERQNRQPDKAKLKVLAARIRELEVPEFKSKGANQIKKEVLAKLEEVAKYCEGELQKL